MKKLFCLLVLSVGVLSCDKSSETSKKEPTSDVIGFKKIEKTNQRDRFGNQAGIIIDLGRGSRKCRGFGICSLRLGSYANAELKQENSKQYLVAELDRKFDTELYDSTLRIDDDLEIENLKLPSGEYMLNEKIGKFGGYKLNLAVKDEE